MVSTKCFLCIGVAASMHFYIMQHPCMWHAISAQLIIMASYMNYLSSGYHELRIFWMT